MQKIGKKKKTASFSEIMIRYYAMVFSVVFILCIGLYAMVVKTLVSNSEKDNLQYNLQLIGTNMESLMEKMKSYSKLIAYNTQVQDALTYVENMSAYDELQVQDTVIRMVSCCSDITSADIIDKEGNLYLAGDIYEVEALREYLETVPWYQDMISSDQKTISAKTHLIRTKIGPTEELFSYVSPVIDLNTQEIIGVLILNIDENQFYATFEKQLGNTDMEVVVMDGSGNTLAASDNSQWLQRETTQRLIEEALAETGESCTSENTPLVYITHDNKEYAVGKYIESDEEENWQIICGIRKGSLVSHMQNYAALSLLLLLVGFFFCVFGAAIITQGLYKPLKNIIFSMKSVEKGKLEKIDPIDTNQEMNELQSQYNKMVDTMDSLLTQKVEEQRTRRKYEVALLQEQIKPHFLYNTLDSICALAQMGMDSDVVKMVSALSQFYRNSLNKGKTHIPIREELQMAENYLIIQQYRFEDVFTVEWDVDEEITEYPVIKLTLQPLIENSINHGFREHEISGTIWIRAKDKGDYIMLQVEDDGMGMKEETLQRILNPKEDDNLKRFGLYGTLRRVNLYYHEADQKVCEVQSEWGEGTKVTIWVPKKQGE